MESSEADMGVSPQRSSGSTVSRDVPMLAGQTPVGIVADNGKAPTGDTSLPLLSGDTAAIGVGDRCGETFSTI